MTTEKKLLGTTPLSGVVEPEAVSFDGTSDYLTRSSNMTGNANSKTFTFSCWIYPTKTVMMVLLGNASRFYFRHDGAAFRFFAYQASGSNSTAFSFSIAGIPINTFSHVLCSIDLANTSNRYVYLNDIAQTVTWSVYNNSLADFSQSAYWIIKDGGAYDGGRLSNFFFDYTYRDLSVTANRRLFIDADGKPSSTIPSNPILYLPMTDAATAGSNSGTGGDFTVNGVLATAERGPNQDNCSASVFDGSADYLSSVSTTTVGTDSKVLTCAFNANDTNAAGASVFMSPAEQGLTIQFAASSGKIVIRGKNAGGTEILSIATNSGIFVSNENIFVSLTIDMASQSNTKIFINNVSQAITFNSFTNDTLEFSTSGSWQIGKKGTTYFTGIIGEFYFNTVYTDLATDNPFWDSDANRPNSVRKVIADTSVTPLIALPIVGNDAGNNLGSGGDFTVNSGPFVGARGGSEFWARSADFNGSTSILKNAVSGLSDSKTSTIFTVFKVNSAKSHILFAAQHNNGSTYANNFVASVSPQGNVVIRDDNNDYVRADDNSANTVVVGQWYALFMSFDLANSSKRYASLVRLSNATVTNLTWVYYVNTAIDYSDVDYDLIGSSMDDGYALLDPADANIASLYFTTEYYDFTQEINRHNFLDQLSYPTDLTQLIEDGDIPNPTTYMKFDNTANLGTNSGTGGAYTNTSVVAGADVTP